MARKPNGSTRYGIGEWYGRRIEGITLEEKITYSRLRGINKEPCPHRPDGGMCNKSGGVCTLALYRRKEDGTAILDPEGSDLVTLCPMRFWQEWTIFRQIGDVLLDSNKPALIKEVGFLQSVDSTGKVGNEIVGRIDMVLAKVGAGDEILEWCALEMQAVYFSGMSMSSEFEAIGRGPSELTFPDKTRRPDFRSSGPKRLMPQLQIKVPALRRWGKKMAVVIDRSFYDSIAPMTRVSQLSNADIAWFVVGYDGPNGEIRVCDTVFTTLESSVEGLTAGEPLGREEFERGLAGFLAKRPEKVIRLS